MTPTSAHEIAGNIYSYIMFGGSTAGLVLANRLSASQSISVLVLEAGEDLTADPQVLDCRQARENLGNERYDWGFKTTKQGGLNGREIPWNWGKMLGGTSGINFWHICYPSAGEVDLWEKLGSNGWSWGGERGVGKYVQKFQT